MPSLKANSDMPIYCNVANKSKIHCILFFANRIQW